MFGTDWSFWRSSARMPNTPEPWAPGPGGEIPQFEHSLTYPEITFSVGVSHCPWIADRAENMERVRPILKRVAGAGRRGAVTYYEETEKAPWHVWSRKLWGWGVQQPVTHCIYTQDDQKIADEFWDVIYAMVRAVPNRVIGLLCNHPLSKWALHDGHTWLRMCETLGAGYIIPTAMMAIFLDWYDRLPLAYRQNNCEDLILSRWLCETGRKSWHPIPTVIQAREEMPTSNPILPSYLYRKSYIDWTDPRVADADLTSIDYWTPKTLPPDYGFSVSEDQRYPRGPFTTAAVCRAHHGGSQFRVPPPAHTGLSGGLAHVLDGSYDIAGLKFDEPPTVIDLGANVGAFSIFISDRFPGARIYAFEPSPESAALCRQNVRGIAQLTECAVVGVDGPSEVMLYEGQSNTGQRSIYQLGEQQGHGVMVPTMRARDLPPCDIFKADTEGCEVELLRDYPHLDGVTAVMVEWHRIEDYHLLLEWLPSIGFELVRDDAKGQWLSDRNLIFRRKTKAAEQAA